MPAILYHIFAEPIFNKWLIYAQLHTITTLLNEAAVVALKKGTLSLHELDDNVKTDPLAVPAILLLHTDPLQTEFLGIIPTRSCNLNCVYCGLMPVMNHRGWISPLSYLLWIG